MNKLRKLKGWLLAVVCGLPLLAQAQQVKVRTVFESDFSEWSSVPTALETVNGYDGTIPLAGTGMMVGVPKESDKTTKYKNTCIQDYKDYYFGLSKGATSEVKIGPIKNLRQFSFIEANTGNSRGSIVFIQGKGEIAETPVLTKAINEYANGSAGGIKHVLNLEDNTVGFTLETDLSTSDFSFTDAQREEAYIIIRNWNGAASSKDTYLFYMSIDAAVTVTADQVTFATEVSPADAGTVEQIPSGSEFDKGSNVTVEAIPAFGYQFVKWTNAAGQDVSTANPYTLAVNENTALKAVFEVKQTYSFSTRCINDLEMNIGSISLNPATTGGKYETGTSVTVTANELPIAKFSNWADEFENNGVTTSVRTVTVNSDMEIVANYEIQDFIAAFNADKAELYANKSGVTYPFAPDYAWDDARNASTCVVNPANNTPIKGNGGTPVVRLRKGCVISSVNGLYTNGYRSTDIAMQVQFSTVDYETARFTADLVAKNGASVNWKVLYSIDGSDYLPVIVNGNELTYQLTANLSTAVSFDLPVEAINQSTVYVRFTGTGDELLSDKYSFDQIDSETGLNYTSNSETGLGNIYVFGLRKQGEDPIPPEMKNITPKNNATGVSANGKITVSFNERIMEGQGEATLTAADGKVITLKPEYGSSSVSFRYNGLTYAMTYTLKLPAGYVTDRSGNDAPAVESSFTVMDRVKPQARVFNAVVDGSLVATIDPTVETIGQYKTIQEAINAVPADNASPWLIFIKAGYYNDLNNLDFPTGKYTTDNQGGQLSASEDSRIVVVDKPFVHLIGEAVDKVTIAQDRVCGGNSADPSQAWYNVAEGATLVVKANDFYCENITIDNEWWTKYTGSAARGPQALALYVEADRAAFNNCRIRSYQDTYLSPKTGNTNAANQQPHYFDRNYFNNCMIEGAVDFIYGGGDVYFDKCTLNIVREEGGYIVAPSHYEDLKDADGKVTDVRTRYGYVFKNTTITAPAGKEAATKVYFGRPWHGEPKTVFIDTECRVKTYPGIWYPTMGAIPALWAVYNMWDANGYPMSTESIEDYYYMDNGVKVEGKAKNYLTDEEAAAYTVENVLQGDGTDTKTGVWNPVPMVEKTTKPVIVGDKGSTTITWTPDEYAICYVVTVNDKVAGFVTEATYEANLTDVVIVQSVNEYGALSEPSDAFTVGTGSGIDKAETSDGATLTFIGGQGTISVRGIVEATTVEIFSILGMQLHKIDTDHNITLAILEGQYIVKAGNVSAKVIVR